MRRATRQRAAATVIFALLCAVVVSLVPLAASAQSASASLLVKLVAGLSPEQQAAVIARNGGIETSSIAALRLHVIQVAADQRDATLARYQADPQVQSAEANKVRLSESIPSDPLYVNQWALPRIGWDQVFGVITPTGSAKVALLDTGVDTSHPELAGKVVPGTSILDGSNGMTDPSGHGTWLAGIIAAQTDTTEGIAGVAYAGVQIMPVTVLNANGEGMDSDVIAGVIWAADHGADVILMAFSNPGFSPNLQDAIDYAWSRGVVLVAAAGNDASSDPHFPAGDRGVMGVAATDLNDALASFSNDGQAIFIAAPGVDIQTIDLGGAYTVISGTSTSAAIVAGAAGLMKAVDPTLTNGIIVGRLARNADTAGTQSQTGNGRVNLPRALADTSTEPIEPAGADPVGLGGPFVGPYRAAARNIRITFAGTGGGQVQISATSGSVSFATTGSNRCDTPPASGIGNNTPAVTINGTCTTLSSSDNNATVTVTAAPGGTSFFAGWSAATGSFTSCNLSNATCSQVLGGGQNDLTVTFTTRVSTTTTASNATATFGAASVTLNATVAPSTVNEGTVTFTVKKGATTIGSPVTSGTVSGGSASATFPLSGVNADTYTIAAVYNPAATNPKFFTSSDNTKTLTVNPAPVTVSITGGPFAYDANPHAATVTLNPSIVGYSVNYTGTATVYTSSAPPTNADTYTVTVTITDPNYILSGSGTGSITINKKLASVTPNVASKTYGDADPALTGTLSGFLAADGVTATYSRTVGETVAGSPYTISATLSPASVLGNYTITSNTANFTINKKLASVTPNVASKTYGDADPTLTGTLSGFLGADGVTATYSRTAGETVAGNPYTISATLSPASVLGNYTITSNTANFTINGKLASVTPAAASKTYGDADPALTGALSGFLAADGVTATYSRAAGETVAGSPYTISATLSPASVLGNYTITSNTANFTINKKLASVTPNVASKTYGDADPALTGTLSGFLAADGVTATYSRTVGETVVGSPYTISATLSPASVLGNYTITSNTANFTINKKPASVTPNVASKTYGDADPALTGTLSGFLAADGVTAAYSRTAGETVAGSPYTISATLSPASVLGNYTITSNTANFTINKKPASVTPNVASKTYGDADPALTGTLSGFLAADGVTATYSRTAGETVAGSPYTISATLSPASVLGNYAITYNTANFTIIARPASVTPAAASKTYGYADPALTGALSGFLAADGVTATYSRTAGETVAGSPYTISATLSPAGVLSNYAITYNTASFTIIARPASVTPAAASKTYGYADPALTGALSGFLAADGVTAAYSRTAGETVAGSPYTISATLSPAGVLSNYAITYNTASFTIIARPASVTPAAASKTYGYADPALTGTLSGFLAADGVTATYSRTAGETVAGSPYAISATLSPAGVLGNYAITYNTASFTIIARPASVTPAAASKTYGYADPALTGTLSGFLAADGVTATYSRTAGETVAGSPYTISATLSPAGVLSNYAITYNTASFTITPRPASVTPNAASKTYGYADPALTGTLSGFVVADGVTATYSRTAGETVAGSPYTISATLSPAGVLSNYAITYNTASFTITPRPASVTPNAASKTYGYADPALTGTLSGFVAADGVTATYSRTAGETVAGSPYTISATLSPASVLGNYAITYNTANFTIIARPASVTPAAASKTYGYADPALTGALSGFLAADGVTAAYSRTAGETVAGSPYTISATLSPASVLGNYAITYNTANFTIIARPASVTPAAASKTYGYADPALTGTLSGFLAADGVSAAYSRTAGETVAGSPYTISATLSPASVLGNYAITYNTANFTITARPASVTPNVASKTYGDADPALTGTLSGFVAGDGVTPSYSRTAGESVGTYTISATLSPAGVLGNYAITYNTASFTITTRPASVTPAAASKIYGYADPALTGTLSGFLAADGVTATYSRTAGETVAGSPYPISATLSPAGVLGNYAITYNTANFTITTRPASVTPAVTGKTYGDVDPALTGTLSGFVAADGVTPSYSRTAGESVGIYTISATLSPAGVLGNYAITYNTANFTITTRPASVTPAVTSKIYGDADPALTGTLSGFVAGDGVTASYSRTAGESVGIYTISATLSPAGVLGNYAITYNTASFTITARPASVTPAAASKTYGYADPALTGTLSGFLAADGVTAAYTRTAGETVAGSPYPISATLSPAGVLGNYAITYNTASFTITARPASVTPAAASKTYGYADPALTGTLSGFLAADGVTAAYTRTAGETVAGSPYPISATLSPAGVLANYAITYNTANFTITARPASVTPAAAGKTYGNSDPALTGTLSGFVAGDGVTASYSRTAGETAGTYTISATLSPAAVLGNYSITYNTASFTITPRPASVTPAAASKTYGNSDPALTGTLSGFVAGDGVTASYSRTAGETAGTYTISATLSPAAVLGNYSITYNTASFTITPRPASVTPAAASKILGALDPALTGTLSGFVAADGVTASYSRNAGETVGSYTISATLSPAAVLGNYNITYNTATFSIFYNFTGFFQPIDNLPVINVAKAGSAIPVKFSLHGNQGLTIFASGSPASGVMTCNSTDPVSVVEETVTAGGSSLQYDPGADQYVYVWKTEKSWTGCRQLVIQLKDGTYHRANFQFK